MASIWDPAKFEQARKSKDMTREEAANQLNISAQYLWTIENGDREPSAKVVRAIAKLYGRTAAFFLCEDQQLAPV